MQRFLLVAVLAAVFTGACSLAPLQRGGSIEGAVFTVDGAPLPGVNVTLIGPNGSPQITMVTDPHGRYEVDEIPFGTYHVTTELSGFTTARQRVEVGAEQPASVTTRLAFAIASI